MHRFGDASFVPLRRTRKLVSQCRLFWALAGVHKESANNVIGIQFFISYSNGLGGGRNAGALFVEATAGLGWLPTESCGTRRSLTNIMETSRSLPASTSAAAIAIVLPFVG